MKVFFCLLALLAVALSQSTSCTVCDFVVKSAEGLLANNLTESEILHFLEGGCDLLPNPLGSECNYLVKSYGPSIIKDLVQGADPEVVCTKLGVCGSKRAVVDVQQGGCSVCQLVVSYVESYLEQNQTEAQIIQQLEQVCSLLGPLGSTCDSFVEQYVPQLIQWIEAGESPQVFCQQVGLCGSQKRTVQQGGCSVCQLVVSYVESYLAQNQTEAQIVQQLEQVCSLLGPLGSTCDSFVEQYVPQLIQWIESGESPQVFCQQVGLCSSNKKRNVQQGGCSVCQLVVSYVESYLAQNQTEAQIVQQLEQVCSLLGPLGSTCDSFVEQYVPQLIQWIEAGESPAVFCQQVGLCASGKRVVADAQQGGCSVCQLVVSYVESYLAQNQTEAQIIQQLEQVCSLLGPLGSTCDSFVEQYVPQLIQWIESGESPAVFCQQVGLCGSGKKRVVADAQQGGCSVCQLVVSYVESYLAQNQTEAQIVQQLEQVCSLLGPLGSTCDSFVEQYVPQLIQWIESGESPQVFCQQVGLCGSQKRNIQQGGCSVCQLVVSYVESHLEQNQTEAQIVQQLDQVCSLLGPLASTCDSFVEQYVPQLIQWIEAGESPAVFCKQVGLCSSGKRAVLDVQQGGCSVCQLVVSYVENFLKSNASITELENELDQLCSILGPLAGTCDQFVALYTPQLVEWILNNEPPQQFCAQVGLCSIPPKKQLQKPKTLKAGASCGLCELVVQYVELFVAQKANEDKIVAAVEGLCTYLPASLENKCNSLIEANLPNLIQYLISKENPLTFCTQVGLCSNQ